MFEKIALFGLWAGMAALWLWDWALMRILLRHERQIQYLKQTSPEEQRCGSCLETECPAKFSGVTYPCPDFRYVLTEEEMEDYYGQEN